MEELFKEVARSIALGAEAAAVLIIGYGAVEAFVLILKRFGSRWKSGARKEAWLRLGMWLLLGLEFELAADIVRSVISPTWVDIGQLGAVAVIRTFLNTSWKRISRSTQNRQRPDTYSRTPNRIQD